MCKTQLSQPSGFMIALSLYASHFDPEDMWHLRALSASWSPAHGFRVKRILIRTPVDALKSLWSWGCQTYCPKIGEKSGDAKSLWNPQSWCGKLSANSMSLKTLWNLKSSEIGVRKSVKNSDVFYIPVKGAGLDLGVLYAVESGCTWNPCESCCLQAWSPITSGNSVLPKSLCQSMSSKLVLKNQ